MAKRKRKLLPWLPALYKGATLLQSMAIYMALHPGKYFTAYQLCRAVSDSWPAVTKYCMRLSTAGLVQLKACFMKEGAQRYSLADPDLLEDPGLPEHLYDLPDNQLILAYAASPELIARVKSSAFLKLIEQRKRQTGLPINKRVIDLLAAKHPTPITVRALKTTIGASESHPDLARRLDALAKLDWVVVTRTEQHPWIIQNPDYEYYLAAAWLVVLSSGGWLRLQQAQHDGTEPPLPKRKRKPRKKKEKVPEVGDLLD